jgi:hypothetical protein
MFVLIETTINEAPYITIQKVAAASAMVRAEPQQDESQQIPTSLYPQNGRTLCNGPTLGAAIGV